MRDLRGDSICVYSGGCVCVVAGDRVCVICGWVNMRILRVAEMDVIISCNGIRYMLCNGFHYDCNDW